MPKVKFMGVYSTKKRSSQLKAVKELFFVWQVKDEGETHIHIQEIDSTYAPKGKVFAIDDTTLSYFTFEPSILAVPLTKSEEVLKVLKKKAPPKPEPTQEPLVEPWQQTPSFTDESLSAAHSAAQLVEAVTRNDFDMALKQMNDPDSRTRALRSIKAILKKKDLKPSHKHMMRDFAYVLRKKKLNEVAVLFAEKTVSLAPKDDHAHFNLARLYCMLGKYRDAREHLQIALDLPHDESEEKLYRKMILHVEQEDRLNRRS
ncbi:MAG: hypothetical protein IJU76_14675 [Desulfovibrionaceae bacterium]|nr:hypothetical protein [Desulfovibrionaceae bacterium]